MNPELAVKPKISPSDAASCPDSSQSGEGEIAALAVDEPESQPRWQFWQVFSSTFVTIFLAELGDKTQVSTLLMSAKFHNPWVIFAGAASALISTSLLGVWFGCWLAARVSPQVLDKAAGIILAFLSIWLLVEVAQG